MISLSRQVHRLQTQIQGEQARLEQVIILASRGRWPEGDIELKRLAITELQECLRTLRWLHENYDRIKAATAGEAA